MLPIEPLQQSGTGQIHNPFNLQAVDRFYLLISLQKAPFLPDKDHLKPPLVSNMGQFGELLSHYTFSYGRGAPSCPTTHPLYNNPPALPPQWTDII